MACCGNNTGYFGYSANALNLNGAWCGCGTNGFIASPATSSICCNVQAMQSVDAMLGTSLDKTARQLIRMGGNVKRDY